MSTSHLSLRARLQHLVAVLITQGQASARDGWPPLPAAGEADGITVFCRNKMFCIALGDSVAAGTVSAEDAAWLAETMRAYVYGRAPNIRGPGLASGLDPTCPFVSWGLHLGRGCVNEEPGP
jgi:hypothetical protein